MIESYFFPENYGDDDDHELVNAISKIDSKTLIEYREDLVAKYPKFAVREMMENYAHQLVVAIPTLGDLHTMADGLTDVVVEGLNGLKLHLELKNFKISLLLKKLADV